METQKRKTFIREIMKNKCNHLFELYSDFCIHCKKSKYQIILEDREADVQKCLKYNFGDDKPKKKSWNPFK